LREQIGIVLQELAVELHLTVRETVSRNAGYYPNPRPVGEVIELVGLAGKEKSKVKSLSGGQKRRQSRSRLTGRHGTSSRKSPVCCHRAGLVPDRGQPGSFVRELAPFGDAAVPAAEFYFAAEDQMATAAQLTVVSRDMLSGLQLNSKARRSAPAGVRHRRPQAILGPRPFGGHHALRRRPGRQNRRADPRPRAGLARIRAGGGSPAGREMRPRREKGRSRDRVAGDRRIPGPDRRPGIRAHPGRQRVPTAAADTMA
jgi:hypothetical protein